MKVFIATKNQKKLVELSRILEPMGFEVLSEKDLAKPLEEIEETGTTFEENARLKADTLCRLTGLACLADDSGLCVDALGGRPGVYSARYAEDASGNRDFDKAIERLIGELRKTGNDDWSAHFSCVLAFAVLNQETQIFEGRVDGKIVPERSGDKGFGFDPVFMPEGFDKTFANFTKEEKAAVSHRGRAFQKFVKIFG